MGERRTLDRYLSRAGVCSRAQAQAWIAEGRVRVDGRVQRASETWIDPAVQRVTLDGAPVRVLERTYLVLNKPVDCVTTRSDPEGRRTVFERLPQLPGRRWVAIGRLDLNSAGLLLFTDSGELANQLMHPRHAIEREYAVRISGALDRETRARLLAGIELEDGPARFERIEAGEKSAGVNRWYRVILREGRNREVRRMFDAVGLQVSRLLRIRMGSVSLPREVRPGRWVELTKAEVETLRSVVR